jgi:hypothetical protein
LQSFRRAWLDARHGASLRISGANAANAATVPPILSTTGNPAVTIASRWRHRPKPSDAIHGFP